MIKEDTSLVWIKVPDLVRKVDEIVIEVNGAAVNFAELTWQDCLSVSAWLAGMEGTQSG